MTTETPATTPTTQTPEQLELAQLKADIAKAYADVDEVSKSVLTNIPQGLQALIPETLSPLEKIRWYEKAKAAGLLIKPTLLVPETDTSKPALVIPKGDPSELPPIARMSYGYATSK